MHKSGPHQIACAPTPRAGASSAQVFALSGIRPADRILGQALGRSWPYGRTVGVPGNILAAGLTFDLGGDLGGDLAVDLALRALFAFFRRVRGDCLARLILCKRSRRAIDRFVLLRRSTQCHNQPQHRD